MMNARHFLSVAVVGLGLILAMSLLLGVLSSAAQPEMAVGDGPVLTALGTISQTCVIPLTGLQIAGPSSGTVGAVYAFTVTVTPLSATLPITYTWQPPPEGGSGTALLPTTHVATYTWSSIGPQTITLTAHNCCNALTQTHTISLQPLQVRLPVVMHNWPPPSWHTQYVDIPRAFEDFTHRGSSLDTQGQLHLAYGGDQLYHAWHDGSDWQVEVVDAGPRVGQWASLALDSADYPHISYFDAGPDCLKYARWDGTAWQVETVDCNGNGGLVGWDTVIVLDSQDRPHISYRNAWPFESDLKYAHWDGTAWQTHFVETGDGAHTGRYNSLAVDGQDRPHISYSVSGLAGEPYSLKHAHWDGVQWQDEVVDVAGYVGDTCLVLDDADQFHIVYKVSETDSMIRYARWEGAQWLTETVTTHDDTLTGLSMALSTGGQPHVSYYQDVGTGSELRYGRWDGSAWQFETVEGGLERGSSKRTSLVLDGAGQAQISYYLEQEALLKQARWDSDTWQTETVDQAAEAGYFTSLALDSASRPHLGYFEKRTNAVKYGRWDGAAWQVETVVSGLDDLAAGLATSMVLDEADQPHFSFYAYADGLYYAHWDGSAWQVESVDPGYRAGECNDLTLDNTGRPHIAYYDIELGAPDFLKHAYWDGSTWQVEIVDVGPWASVYHRNAIAIDDANRPHIAYYDTQSDDLKYARWDGSTWITETVDASGRVGEYGSLALDDQGYAHIGYRDMDDRDLKYARWDGTTWQIETVDSEGYVGYFSSLILDSAGRPHIGYYDDTHDYLKYARWDGVQWHIETVNNEGEGGWFLSLALNGTDQPHFGYQDPYLWDVKYTWWGP